MNSLGHLAYRLRIGIAMSVSAGSDGRINRVLDHKRMLYASLSRRQRLSLFCLGIPAFILLAGVRAMPVSGMPLKPQTGSTVANTQDTQGVRPNASPLSPLPRLAQVDHPTFTPLLIKFRDTHDIAEKEKLLNQITHDGPEAVAKQLLQLAKATTDGDTCWLAIRGLGVLKFEQAAPFLIESLQSPERYVRANAARALGELQYSTAVPALIHLLAAEQDSGVIEQTSLALRMMRTDDAIPILESRMSDGTAQTPQTQCWLLDAIGGLGSKEDLSFIAKYLYVSGTSIVGVQECAARAIATQTGEDFGLPKTSGLYDPMMPILKARKWWETPQNRDQLK